MKIFTTKKDLFQAISSLKSSKKKIGLVPTMGALHQGHISLIEQSKRQADITVTSIFVNPTQFNDKNDLLSYPKPFDDDCRILKENGCDILFHPDVTEVYTPGEKWEYEVGNLDSLLEGKFRPGHFKGVTQIVHKLFSMVNPDFAFFGQKDYQQLAVIKKMVKDFELPIQLVACPIIREKDGLALSSRNIRLSKEERHAALNLYKALSYIKSNYSSSQSLQTLLQNAVGLLQNSILQLEYLKICDPVSLAELQKKQENAVALIACYSGKTRLIDNMMLP